MQIHRNQAAAFIARHGFTPRVAAVAGNGFPAISFDVPFVHMETKETGLETVTISPDRDGLFSLSKVKLELGY